MHNSGDLDNRPTRTGDDDTEHVLARSATDTVTAPAYTMTARLLHWITALVILFMIPIGVIIANEWGGSLQNSLRLYALLIVQPFVGWIATSAYPASIKVFGWVELPPIWSENRALSGQLFFIHRWIGIAIAGLVVAHVGAALHHHFVRKDRVLMRMITG